jgi:alpha-L-rhamnosidase
MDAAMMADMAAAIGQDAECYLQMERDAMAYIKKFFNADGTFKTAILNTMQTPALFALRVGAVEGEGKAAMIVRLRKNFEEHGNCLQTGFLGTSILMPTLTENGMNDIAYELLFQRKNPSWIYSIDNGATTIWERWNSYTLEHGILKSSMNSFNHYAYGCVCEWIWETVAGIAADAKNPGFKHIIMRPMPDKRLGFVNAEYKSAAGVIKSAWRYEGDKWIWEFTIPEGATASVTLPGESVATTYTSGSYKIVK